MKLSLITLLCIPLSGCSHLDDESKKSKLTVVRYAEIIFLSLLSSLHGICSDGFYSFLHCAQSNKIDVVSLSHDEATTSSRPVFHDIHGEYEKACCVAKKQAS
jgi:hypothetical protein